MNLKFFISTFFVLIALADYSWGQTKIECWKRFELTFNYKATGNPSMMGMTHIVYDLCLQKLEYGNIQCPVQ